VCVCVCVLMAGLTCGALISQLTTGVQPHPPPDSNQPDRGVQVRVLKQVTNHTHSTLNKQKIIICIYTVYIYNNFLLTKKGRLIRVLIYVVIFYELQTQISHTAKNNNNKVNVSGPDTEIYGPPVWIRDLRAARASQSECRKYNEDIYYIYSIYYIQLQTQLTSPQMKEGRKQRRTQRCRRARGLAGLRVVGHGLPKPQHLVSGAGLGPRRRGGEEEDHSMTTLRYQFLRTRANQPNSLGSSGSVVLPGQETRKWVTTAGAPGGFSKLLLHCLVTVN